MSDLRIFLHDEVLIRGMKRFEMVYILDNMPDLRETITHLIETGLSNAERMPEVLKVIESILSQDNRFHAIATDVRRYREVLFSRRIPFSMIEARAMLSRIRKWQNAIERAMQND